MSKIRCTGVIPRCVCRFVSREAGWKTSVWKKSLASLGMINFHRRTAALNKPSKCKLSEREHLYAKGSPQALHLWENNQQLLWKWPCDHRNLMAQKHTRISTVNRICKIYIICSSTQNMQNIHYTFNNHLHLPTVFRPQITLRRSIRTLGQVWVPCPTIW